jgi:hypothetical protein
MRVFEILEATRQAFKHQGNKITRKYRCTSGPRKGQVRSSPAACNAPINIKKRQTLNKTKAKLGSHRAVTRARHMAVNPQTKFVAKMNKQYTPKRRKKMK